MVPSYSKFRIAKKNPFLPKSVVVFTATAHPAIVYDTSTGVHVYPKELLLI